MDSDVMQGSRMSMSSRVARRRLTVGLHQCQRLKPKQSAILLRMAHMKTRHLVRISHSHSLLQRSLYPPRAAFATSPDSSIEEPTTGPLFWEKRRAEWLKDPLEPRIPSPSDENVPGTKARARLEELLAEPLAEEVRR